MMKIIQQNIVILIMLCTFGCAAWKAAPKETPGLLNEGKGLYVQACIWCHGTNGDGKGEYAIKLHILPSNFTKPLDQWNHTQGDPQRIFNVITNGIPGTAMAKFHYTKDQRWALTYAVMDFGKGKNP